MSSNKTVPVEWVKEIVGIFRDEDTDYEAIAFTIASKYPDVFLECASDVNPLRDLTDGVNKVYDIKAIRAAKPGMSLHEAKLLVESFHDYVDY